MKQCPDFPNSHSTWTSETQILSNMSQHSSCDKIPGKAPEEKGFSWLPVWGIQPIMVGRLEGEVWSGCLPCMLSYEAEWGVHSLLSPAHRVLWPTLRMCLPTSVKPLGIPSQRSQSCFPGGFKFHQVSREDEPWWLSSFFPLWGSPVPWDVAAMQRQCPGPGLDACASSLRKQQVEGGPVPPAGPGSSFATWACCDLIFLPELVSLLKVIKN